VKAPVISIIDDDESTRTALTGLMRARGFDARSYASAEAFLEAGVCETSQCIITDIQMPGLTGIELKHKLDAIKCATPVIMITARGEQRLHNLAIASGPFHLLRKPFKSDALIAWVEKALAG